MALYFAYGLDADPKNLPPTLANPVPVGIGCLDGFMLAFRAIPGGDGGGVADIVPAPDGEMWGVLYELASVEQEKILDAARGLSAIPQTTMRETVRLRVERAANGAPAEVRTGRSISAFTYRIADRGAAFTAPSGQYLKDLVAAAIGQDLPAAQFLAIAGWEPTVPGHAIRDIEPHAQDTSGAEILSVYIKVPPRYAVYRIPERVAIQYADNPAEADYQRRSLAVLNPVRSQINALLESPGSWLDREATTKRVMEQYNPRVAAALIMALEGDVNSAKSTLEDMRDEIKAWRMTNGRFWYLVFSFATAAVGLAAVGLVGYWFGAWVPLVHPRLRTAVTLAGLAGTVGALFSIALALRDRSVLSDFNKANNFMDSALRIFVGSIAGPVLILFLQVGLLQTSGGGPLAAPAVLCFGFVAGFLERLVPDLLKKTAEKEFGAPSSNGAAPAGAAK